MLVAGSLVLLRWFEALGEPAKPRLTRVAVPPALCAAGELLVLLAMTHPGGGMLLAALAYAISVAKALARSAAVLALARVAPRLPWRLVGADPHETI